MEAHPGGHIFTHARRRFSTPCETRIRAHHGSKLVLVPVACVGAGKSTLGALLKTQLPDLLSHVQNDDIRVKRRGPDRRWPFDAHVVRALAKHPVVFADRNNHTIELRMELVESVRQAYPNATIAFVVWPLPEEDRDKVYAEVLRRIYERGERHQSLTPGKTSELERVVGQFVYKRDEVYADEVAWAAGEAAGSGSAHYVRMDVFADPSHNAKGLVGALRKLDWERRDEWDRVAMEMEMAANQSRPPKGSNLKYE